MADAFDFNDEVEAMTKKSDRPEDFESFVIKHENRLYRTALSIMGNVADAEDVVQEAFIKAHERASEFQSDVHEKAWLMRVTVNLCNSRLRSPWRKRTVTLTESLPAKTPEQRELLESVMSLSPKYRTVIHLFYYEGYATREIAELTGQRESTVRSLLTRARQKLGSVLKEDEGP